jgi:hypothetical protein
MKNKRPPQAAIDAAKRVFECEAYLQSITPICKEIETVIFETLQLVDVADGHIVKGWNDFSEFDITGEQADMLNIAFDHAYKVAGFKVESGYSPLLMAENAFNRAKFDLTELMYDFLALDSAALRNPQTRNKLIHKKEIFELSMNYVVQFVK